MPWALDSGGFSELSIHGRWTLTAADYAREVRRYQDEIGRLDFAAAQDWMCEPAMLRRTRLSVEEHQQRTIRNYLELCSLAPEVPWMPVLQGWCHGDYLEHLDAYAAAGVDLTALPRVGVGSICRRQQTVRAALILADLASCGLKLHGFGFKLQGLRLAAGHLSSADSMAWSYHERREKSGRQNRLEAALEWAALHVDPLTQRR